MIELLAAERHVAKSHGVIEQQHHFIEDLGYAGCDKASALIEFGSLLVSVSLRLQDRQ